MPTHGESTKKTQLQERLTAAEQSMRNAEQSLYENRQLRDRLATATQAMVEQNQLRERLAAAGQSTRQAEQSAVENSHLRERLAAAERSLQQATAARGIPASFASTLFGTTPQSAAAQSLAGPQHTTTLFGMAESHRSVVQSRLCLGVTLRIRWPARGNTPTGAPWVMLIHGYVARSMISQRKPTNPESWPHAWRDVGDMLLFLDQVYITVDVLAQAHRDFQALEQEALVPQMQRSGPGGEQGWIRLFRDLSNNIADRAFRKCMAKGQTANGAVPNFPNILPHERRDGGLYAPTQIRLGLTDVLREIAASPSQALSADEAASLAPTAVLRSILIWDDNVDPDTIPPRLRAFHDWIAEARWLRRVTEEDIQKYLDGRPPATITGILGELPPEYHDLARALVPRNADPLPPHRPFDHKIELLPGQTPPDSRARPMSPHELLAVRKYIDDHLEKGFTRPSGPSAAAPILLAKKPNYRGLNNVTVKNRYPIPLVRETLDALCSARISTKLDIVAAFNRLRIAPGDECKTAFITQFGLFGALIRN
ncbi:hypothetical protein DL766_008951 [Monosporascus sp. MC13-8B]|uniref:Reverse transcriptase domain-containing protein n=1 Tax=Monosporascus cannonballus TaxID=155416 RepID=A0ABY0GSR1_9PEZI|nr:hypothetical protein DL762_009663 [Monosporascus cannonballus]RYP17218.1 hypothetical protein DL766_008951 [Monosporascus sp. MC13-8B]